MKVFFLILCLLVFFFIRIFFEAECTEASSSKSCIIHIMVKALSITIVALLILMGNDFKEYYTDYLILHEVEKEDTVEILESAYNPYSNDYEYTLLMPEGYEYVLIIDSKNMSKIDSKFISIRYGYGNNLRGNRHYYFDIKLLQS